MLHIIITFLFSPHEIYSLNCRLPDTYSWIYSVHCRTLLYDYYDYALSSIYGNGGEKEEIARVCKSLQKVSDSEEDEEEE